MSLQLLAEGELKRIHADYQFTAGGDSQGAASSSSDREILAQVEAQSRKALIGAIMDGVMAGLLMVSVIINCVSLGKPLREAKGAHTKRVEKRVYGRLSEEPTPSHKAFD